MSYNKLICELEALKGRSSSHREWYPSPYLTLGKKTDEYGSNCFFKCLNRLSCKRLRGPAAQRRLSNQVKGFDVCGLPVRQTPCCARCFLQFLSLKLSQLFLHGESGLRLRSGLLLQHRAALFVSLLGFSQTQDSEKRGRGEREKHRTHFKSCQK